ncbi:hypothetical protein BU25DRAFT_423381 [Macroventuria anomochaeta]|uniref:Uncharacterized protein n=1 Tax=Macroventuria anomochaeta TaxID=301207 RepID=A0ACB6RVY7_9PLEO|nr:uncharacterized protein BU25DRAFT_423381 [Macroventuria anomochaeta]KAF2625298.1 hypothetical protein BU25DRAFT_423381 [Macroventuria anomochaeta]
MSKDNSPRVNANISQALSAAGPLSGPNTVAIKASQDFEVSFPSDVFDSDSKLSYFATLSDHTSLPAWISFDPSLLHFTGTTPPTSILQYFGILLIASDTPDDRDIQSPSADLPDWLAFGGNSFDVPGTAPSELSSQDLTISTKDIYGDLAQHTVHLNVVSESFSGTVGTLNITMGELFKVQLPQPILAKDDEVVTVDFTTLVVHMHFNPTTFTIFGTVSEDMSPQVVQCSMAATSKYGSLKESHGVEWGEGAQSA